MRPNMKWIVAVLVVAIIVLAYFAIVGVQAKVPDVVAQKDPTGQERDPIAYAVIDITCGLRKPMFSSWEGRISLIAVQVYDWTPGTGQMYEQQKLDLLGFLQSHPDVWVVLTWTGPGNYVPQAYTSPHQKFTVNTETAAWTDTHFGPYTAKFWDAGQYTLTVKFYRMDNNNPALMATATQIVVVS